MQNSLTGKIHIALTQRNWRFRTFRVMQKEPLAIEDAPGPREGQRILRLAGPLTMNNLYDFQSKVRSDESRTLVLDMSAVPYVDSAGLGALVGAYVTRQNGKRQLSLVGVNERVRTLMQVTHVEQFFRMFDDVSLAATA
jgi:anti-sigma B factor antagonist